MLLVIITAGSHTYGIIAKAKVVIMIGCITADHHRLSNWVGPSGHQKKFELSSCLETTWQGINIYSWRRWRRRPRIGNTFRRFIRRGSPWTQAVPEVFNPRLKDRSCYLEAPACYIWPIRPEYHQRWRFSVGANQTIDAFLKHLAKEDEVQATQHREAISKEDLEKLFSYFYSKSDTNQRVLTQAVWFFTTCHFGLRSREVDRVAWRLFIYSFKFSFWFKGHKQLHSAAMKRGWWFIYDQEPGVDRGFMHAQRSGKCVCDVTKLYELILRSRRSCWRWVLPLQVRISLSVPAHEKVSS